MQSVQIGQVLEFEYPRHNYHQVPSKLERRRLLVQRIRDLAASPLEPLTVQLDPLKRRGRLLVTGHDLDKRAERSFYLDSMLPAQPPETPYKVLVGESRIEFESPHKDAAEAFADEWNRIAGAEEARIVVSPKK